MRNAPRINGALAVTTRQEVTQSVPDAIDEVPEPRYCRFTRAYCRCWPIIDTPTMITCQRHFLDDEEAGHE